MHQHVINIIKQHWLQLQAQRHQNIIFQGTAYSFNALHAMLNLAPLHHFPASLRDISILPCLHKRFKQSSSIATGWLPHSQKLVVCLNLHITWTTHHIKHFLFYVQWFYPLKFCFWNSINRVFIQQTQQLPSHFISSLEIYSMLFFKTPSFCKRKVLLTNKICNLKRPLHNRCCAGVHPFQWSCHGSIIDLPYF